MTRSLAAKPFRRLKFEPLEDRRLLAVITVDTLLDEDDGIAIGDISLRDALSDANSNDTIEFAVQGTILLTNGELLVNKPLIIDGPGTDLLTIDARGESRVFNIDDGSGALIDVEIAGLTITGGVTGADGGGILNRETLTVTACHITGNVAEDGGGIGNFSGTFEIAYSTISDNTASEALGGGAGIFNFSSSKAQTSTIVNSTISNNVSTSRGGGIYNFLGTIIVEYSTITENDAPANQGSGIASLGDTNVVSTQVRSTIIAGNLHSDVDIVVGFQPTFQSLNYNLIGSGTSTGSFTTIGDVRNVADPLLGPLTDNGGPMQTHLPLVGSPAIDTGNPSFAPPPDFDQRGELYARVFDGNSDSIARIDKGAVERDVVLFQVSTLADENDLDFSAGDFSLREAIGQAALLAAGTPTITFEPSLTAGSPVTINLGLGELEVDARMNIDGPGASLLTLDAHHDFRVLKVDDSVALNPVEVRISGLTIANGGTTEGGGGIFSNERLTVADCVITGNRAQWGGGIYNGAEGNLIVARSQISGNNTIEPVPETLGSGGGGLYNWHGKVSILDSTISGNDSVTAGGGILIADNGYVRVDRTAISDNTATDSGGGIHNGDGNLSITNSTISGNHAKLGGGVLMGAPNDRVAVFSNSTISGNVAPDGGGGVNNISGRVFFEFCTITRNVANDFAGSGVLSSPSVADSPTSFYSTIIAFNFAPHEEPGPGKLDVAVSGATNSLISRGYNIVGRGGFVNETFDEMGDEILADDDPLLGPLADNGGPTLTHSLLSGSPALDHGDSSPMAGIFAVPKYDQRGKPFSRIRDGDVPASIVMDIGAFEAQAIPPALPGDYNLNNVVDAADYVVWRNTRGNTLFAYSGADGNGNGIVDDTDYGVWRRNFGNTPTPAAAAVVYVEQMPTPPAVRTQETLAIAAAPATASAMPGAADGLVIFAPAVDLPRFGPRHDATTLSRAAARSDDALIAWVVSRANGAKVAEDFESVCADFDRTAEDATSSFRDAVDAAFEQVLAEY